MRSFVVILALLVAQAQPLRVETATVPAPVASEYYNFQLVAAGGTPPYRWSLAQGTLPTGLRLDNSGLILGTPTQAGKLSFTVRVTDSSTPPQAATRELSAEIQASISLVWKRTPRVENGGIFGVAAFTNHLREPVELTLIIVAVNEVNKSFVLGYQRATIRPRTTTPDIPFGFTLPRGAYVVHADAYADRDGALLHTRLQTLAALQTP